MEINIGVIMGAGQVLQDVVARFGNVAARSLITRIVDDWDLGREDLAEFQGEAEALELLSTLSFCSEDSTVEWQSGGGGYSYDVATDKWEATTTRFDHEAADAHATRDESDWFERPHRTSGAD